MNDKNLVKFVDYNKLEGIVIIINYSIDSGNDVYKLFFKVEIYKKFEFDGEKR